MIMNAKQIEAKNAYISNLAHMVKEYATARKQ